MLAGRREFEGEILKEVGLNGSSPTLRMEVEYRDGPQVGGTLRKGLAMHDTKFERDRSRQ